MILIADSGSTNTVWCLGDKRKESQRFITPGINPYFQSEEEIADTISRLMLPQLPVAPEAISEVYFYGAGCTPDKVEIVRRVIEGILPNAAIEVHSDLLAAARGLFGRQAGIACILGTGSNSCFYDGSKIADTVSPLGFILGDEGSGAVLGKLLVGDLLKGMMPENLKEKFLKQFNLTPALIIDKVYRQPFPNRFLAGLSPFLAEHLEEPGVQGLVYRAFYSFFERNVMRYDYPNYAVSLSGSVAFYYADVLKEVAADMGITISQIVQSPMEGLIAYHKIY